MPETTPTEPEYVINYTVHIHDNHGTINIQQTGKPDETPPPPDPTIQSNP